MSYWRVTDHPHRHHLGAAILGSVRDGDGVVDVETDEERLVRIVHG
jgi:hypothetical protein